MGTFRYRVHRMLSALRRIVRANMPKTKSLGLFLFGLVTGAEAMVVVQPADFIKTELQLEQRRVTQLEKDPEGVWGFIIVWLGSRSHVMSMGSWFLDSL